MSIFRKIMSLLTAPQQRRHEPVYELSMEVTTEYVPSRPRGRTGERIGTDRFKPNGEWVQTTTVESVAGVNHYREAVEEFIAAIEDLYRAGARYGVFLYQEPDNIHDKNAIIVYGFVDTHRPPRVFQLGYLSRETSREIYRDIISKGIDFDAELYGVFISDTGYIDVRIIVLAPPGHGMKSRLNPSNSKVNRTRRVPK